MEIQHLASLILPEGLLNNFEVKRVEKLCQIADKSEEYHIWLDEKNKLPLSNIEYESKGFDNVKGIQDFPIRGKACYLHVRRRKWRHKKGLKPDIKSDYRFEATGVKLTKELASFLKG